MLLEREIKKIANSRRACYSSSMEAKGYETETARQKHMPGDRAIVDQLKKIAKFILDTREKVRTECSTIISLTEEYNNLKKDYTKLTGSEFKLCDGYDDDKKEIII